MATDEEVNQFIAEMEETELEGRRELLLDLTEGVAITEELLTKAFQVLLFYKAALDLKGIKVETGYPDIIEEIADHLDLDFTLEVQP